MFQFWRRPSNRPARPEPTRRAPLRLETMEERSVPSAGSLDQSFGASGQLVIGDAVNATDGGTINRAAAFMPDGSMYVVGTVATFNNGYEFSVEHYNSAGQLDTNFGTNGRSLVSFNGDISRGYAAAVQPDGKIVVVGSVNNTDPSRAAPTAEFAIARLNPNGSLDTTFGTNGEVTTKFGSGIDDVAQDVQVLANGQILVAGTAGTNAFVVSRYNADGGLDTTFGNQGGIVYQTSEVAVGAKLQVAADNSLLLVAHTHGAVVGDTWIAKFDSTGQVVSSFGTNGAVRVGGWDSNITLQLDGKILVAGPTNQVITGWNGPSDFMLMRYNANGTRDTSFGSGGVVVTHFAAGDSQGTVVAVQTNGDIVVGGVVNNVAGAGLADPVSGVATNTGLDFAMARYHADGTLDSAFGSGGTLAIDFNSFSDTLSELKVLGDGTIMVAGSSAQASMTNSLAVAKIDGRIAPRGHLIVAGDGATGPAEVKAWDAETGQLVFDQVVFDNFGGGVRVATGDVNGDGIADIIVAAGPSGGPEVKVYDGATGSLISNFFAYGQTFTGGVYIAVGDLYGDGKEEIITGAGASTSGGSHVKVFDVAGNQLQSFFAYNSNFHGGVRVAAGDVSGVGHDDIITAAGPGGGPHVEVWDGPTGARLQSYFAYDRSFTGGVFVAAGNVSGTGHADVITGADAGGGPSVRIYDGLTTAEVATYFAFDPSYTGGVRVAAVDRDGSGKDDVLVVGGPNGGSHVLTISGSVTLLNAFNAFDPSSPRGTFIA
ncbi:MAG: FG-GAP-like repeat-containing protein [Gemmataceae bacterium]